MNNLFDEKMHYNQLYSFYQNLLTTKQQEIFNAYFLEDYSITEIADGFQISRNAVFDSLKTTKKILDDLESKLHLNELSIKRQKLYQEYKSLETLPLIEKLQEME